MIELYFYSNIIFSNFFFYKKDSIKVVEQISFCKNMKTSKNYSNLN